MVRWKDKIGTRSFIIFIPLLELIEASCLEKWTISRKLFLPHTWCCMYWLWLWNQSFSWNTIFWWFHGSADHVQMTTNIKPHVMLWPMAHIKNYKINLSMRMTFLGQSQSVMPTEINEFTVDCISSQLL